MRLVIHLAMVLVVVLAAAGAALDAFAPERLRALGAAAQSFLAAYGLSQPPEPPPLPLDAALAAKGLARGDPVFIRIVKETSQLELFMRPARADAEGAWRLVKVYPVCRWSGELGPKLREGDKQAPEGFYAVTRAALNPNSAHHLSFNLGFPNAYDRAQGRTGSFLMVHGGCSSIGCYAMTDPAIEEIYRLVEAALRAGQGSVPVHIFPFRMTDAAIEARSGHRWSAFWRTLKTGWDAFERTGAPPRVFVCAGAYVFDPVGGSQRGSSPDARLDGCSPVAGL